MTVPLMEIPQVVQQFLSGFEGVFSKPQLQHFAEYATGLIVNPNKTVTGINDAFLAHRRGVTYEKPPSSPLTPRAFMSHAS